MDFRFRCDRVWTRGRGMCLEDEKLSEFSLKRDSKSERRSLGEKVVVCGRRAVWFLRARAEKGG